MTWSQTKRPYRLTTPLGEDALLLVRFEGEERVSSLFRFRVTALSTRDDIAAKELLLKPVTLLLRLPDFTDRAIHGIVSRLGRGGSAPDGLHAYEIEIVPPHWVLSRDEGFDIFQARTSREVCETLLQGTSHDWKLSSTPTARPYCFRYRESRWQCISRLLEQEGIWYRFEHRPGDTKMVLSEAVASAKAAWGLSTLQWAHTDLNAPRLLDLRMEMEPYVAETHLRSATEFLPNQNLEATTPSSGAFKPPPELSSYLFEQQLGSQHSRYSHSGSETSGDVAKFAVEMKAYARRRQELAESQSVRYSGETRCVGLETGAKVQVADHPNKSMNVSLFLTAVRHDGSNGSYDAGDDFEASYRNTFEAIPSTAIFRPARLTPWPRVGGSHVGVVVGPDGEEIYTDGHGRVQVVMHWNTDHKMTLAQSCWIRVAQSFAGQQFGSVFLPRIGHEVLVEFLDGNPDNPVIVGSLYNAANMPPWKLPENKTQSGIRTKSTLKGGADNHNELRFEDKKDQEQIFVQAEKDLDVVVKHNETRKVGHDRTTTIKHDETKTVEEGNETTTIAKGTQVIKVADNNRSLHVEKDHSVKVNGAETITVAKDRTVTVAQTQTYAITKDNVLTVKGKQARTITGDDTTEIKEGDSSLRAKLGKIAVEAKVGNITVKTGAGSITMEAMQAIELKVGANSIKIDQTGITMKGIMVKIEGQAMADVKAPMVQINGDAVVKIQGAITMIN